MGMQTGWTKADLKGTPDALEVLQNFKTSVTAVTDIVTTVVDMAKTVLEFVLKFMVSMKDLEAITMKAAIAAARAILKDLTESASAYFLFVPIRAVDPESWLGDPKNYYIGQSGFRGFPWLQPLQGPNHIAQPSGGSGGNYGFYSQVAESLQDDKDIMRPTYSDDSYVASMVFLAGADPLNAANLIILWKKLMKLFRNVPGIDTLPLGLADPPKGFRASLVPIPPTGKNNLTDQWVTGKADFTQPLAVRLDWDKPEKTWVAQSFGNIELEITHIVFWRWNNGAYQPEQVQVAAQNALYVTEDWTFESKDPITMQKEIRRKEVEFHGTAPLFYFDTTVKTGNTYEYGISYKMVQKLEEGDVPYETDLIPLRVSIPANPHIGPRQGVPPDWFAANIFSTIPGLGDLVLKINAWLDTLEASIKKSNDELQDYINFLEAEITRYSSWINEISNTIQELVDALTWPSAYVGVWIMEPGMGGNDYFLSQLGKSLFNQADPDRPPFDLGSELVCGFVLYTGSETAGALQKFSDTIQLLFGNLVAGTKNSFLDAADSLGALGEKLDDEICLTQALVRETCGGKELKLGTTSQSLDASVESPDCARAGLSSVEPKSKFTETNDIWK